MSVFEVEGNEGLPNFEILCTFDITNDTLFKTIDNAIASFSVIDAIREEHIIVMVDVKNL